MGEGNPGDVGAYRRVVLSTRLAGFSSFNYIINDWEERPYAPTTPTTPTSLHPRDITALRQSNHFFPQIVHLLSGGL
jgi:hypothetical protein